MDFVARHIENYGGTGSFEMSTALHEINDTANMESTYMESIAISSDSSRPRRFIIPILRHVRYCTMGPAPRQE